MALYALARLTIQVRSGERSLRSAAVVAVVPVLALPLLSAAVLYPRLKLLPRTSIGQGYLQLGLLTKQLGGFRHDTAYELSPLFNRGSNLWWGTGFARGPGSYVGAATILLIAFGIWSRRWRLPAIGVRGMRVHRVGAEPGPAHPVQPAHVAAALPGRRAVAP